MYKLIDYIATLVRMFMHTDPHRKANWISPPGQIRSYGDDVQREETSLTQKME